MFYDDDHKLLHVHIPRTAGESIHMAMSMQCENYVKDEDSVPPASYIKEYVGDRCWNEAYKFAVTRPYDEWITSVWKYLTSNPWWLTQDARWARLSKKNLFHQAREYHNGTLQNWLDNFVWDSWVPNGEYSITETRPESWLGTDDVDLWDISMLPEMVDHIYNITGVHLLIPHANANVPQLRSVA